MFLINNVGEDDCRMKWQKLAFKPTVFITDGDNTAV